MAIKLTFTDSAGIEYVDSYHRIGAIKLDEEVSQALISVYIYANEQARLDGKDVIVNTSGSKHYTFVVPSSEYLTYFDSAVLDAVNKNPVSQAYLYIKTLGDPYDYLNSGVDV